MVKVKVVFLNNPLLNYAKFNHPMVKVKASSGAGAVNRVIGSTTLW